VVAVAGILSVILFAIAFILYASKSGNPVPWDPTGFMLLGLIALSVHLIWPWHPWRNPPA
jgi:multisubunit Na+/H+ antiporter MnhB subunit